MSQVSGQRSHHVQACDTPLLDAREARIRVYAARAAAKLPLFNCGESESTRTPRSWHLTCLHCGVEAAITRYAPRPRGWRVIRVCNSPVAECPACAEVWNEVHGRFDCVHGRRLEWVTRHQVRDQRGRHQRKAVTCG